MKRLAFLAALPLALGLGIANAQDDDEFGVVDDQGIYDDGLWESDNWGYDDYGIYDQDFTWQTDAGWYDDWYTYEDTDEAETAHYGLFGWDDAGEWGFWDW